MSHGAELALLLLESVLEGQDTGSLLPVDLLVVHDQDHGGGIHGLSCTFMQINQGGGGGWGGWRTARIRLRRKKDSILDKTGFRSGSDLITPLRINELKFCLFKNLFIFERTFITIENFLF